MSLTCIYHAIEEMKVVPYDERDKLVATGEWFDHPNDVKKIIEDIKDERQIRQRTRRGKNNS